MRRREVVEHQPTGAMTGQVTALLRSAQHAPSCPSVTSLSRATNLPESPQLNAKVCS